MKSLNMKICQVVSSTHAWEVIKDSLIRCKILCTISLEFQK